jgi:dihydrofolate reductase
VQIIAVAALSDNQVIGVENRLPWHLPEDLAHFKALTLDKPIIMGRKTFDSIGRALPKRRNIVLSRQKDLSLSGCDVVSTFEQALALVKGADQIMVIGGEMLYRLAWPYLTHLELTRVHLQIEGDTFFPTLEPKKWRETAKSVQSNGAIAYTFISYERVGTE